MTGVQYKRSSLYAGCLVFSVSGTDILHCVMHRVFLAGNVTSVTLILMEMFDYFNGFTFFFSFPFGICCFVFVDGCMIAFLSWVVKGFWDYFLIFCFLWCFISLYWFEFMYFSRNLGIGHGRKWGAARRG